MARLLIKTKGFGERALVLRLGVNRVGRGPECELCLDHPTVSTRHCDLILTASGVDVRDGGSTNGTFINGTPVREARLESGQTLRVGDIELGVESTDAPIAIPQFERPSQVPPPPGVLPGGQISCPRHLQAPATFRCTECKELMCNGCVKVMRRKGGRPHFLCVRCSHPSEPFPAAPSKKKKGFLELLKSKLGLKSKPAFLRRAGGK